MPRGNRLGPLTATEPIGDLPGEPRLWHRCEREETQLAGQIWTDGHESLTHQRGEKPLVARAEAWVRRHPP